MVTLDPRPEGRWSVHVFGRIRNAARLRKERESHGAATPDGDEGLATSMIAEAGIEAVIPRLSLDGGVVAKAPDGRRWVAASGECRQILGWNLDSVLRVGHPGDVAAAVGRERDPAALWLWLATGVVPPPLTAFRRVTALAAGHLLLVDPAPVVKAWRAVRRPTPGREGRVDVWTTSFDRALRVAVAQRLPVDGVITGSELDRRVATIAREKGDVAARTPRQRLRLEDGFAAHPAPEDGFMAGFGGAERFLAAREGWLGRARRRLFREDTALDRALVDEALHRLRAGGEAEAADPRTAWRLPFGPSTWADAAEGPLGPDVLWRWARAPARLAGLQRVAVELPLMAPELDDRLGDIPMGLRSVVLERVLGPPPVPEKVAPTWIDPIPRLTAGGRATARWGTVRACFEQGIVV